MIALLRALVAATGISMLAAGLAFWLDLAGLRQRWPFPETRLGYLFIASMALSQGAVLLWQAWALELRAARGGAVGFAVMNAAICGYALSLHGQRGDATFVALALSAGVMALGALALAGVGGRFPIRDPRPAPAVVRWSFLAFGVALSAAIALLLARAEVVFPWPLGPESSTLFGLYFVASAIYFLDGFLRPGWANAQGQLLGFLVYDLVLIQPWLAHFAKARGGFRVSLVVYLAVIAWSGLLAAYFLFLSPATRFGRRARATAVSSEASG